MNPSYSLSSPQTTVSGDTVRKKSSSLYARFIKVLKRINIKLFHGFALEMGTQYFYVSRMGNNLHSGKRKSRPIADPMALKEKLNTGDVVSFKRDEMFIDNGFYHLFRDRNIFMEAYGHGDNPLIKTKDDFIEIQSSAWF